MFAAADSYQYPTQAPTGLRVEPVGLDGANFSWGAQYYLNAGYQVYLDGTLLGYSGSTTFPLRGLDPARTYTAEVKAIWDDGTVGPRHQKSELKFTLQSLLPNEVPLSSLEPVPGLLAEGGAAAGAAVRPARLPSAANAMKAASALAPVRKSSTTSRASSRRFRRWWASMTAMTEASALSVVGDGKELWSSGPMKKSDGPQAGQRQHRRRKAARPACRRCGRGSSAGPRPRPGPRRACRSSGSLAGGQDLRACRSKVAVAAHAANGPNIFVAKGFSPVNSADRHHVLGGMIRI